MTNEPIVVVAALAILGLLLNWLFKVLQPTIITALAITGIVLGLQLFLGVGPETLGQEVVRLPEHLWQFWQQFARTYLSA